MLDGSFLVGLAHYGTAGCAQSERGRALIQAVRGADGLIIASPGYHGTVSGLVKNAIDYLEETARDDRVYLEGLPVGLIATAYGWQATGSTMAALRSIAHALRAWPTPLGATVRCGPGFFEDARAQLEMVGKQVVQFALVASRVAGDQLAVAPDQVHGAPRADDALAPGLEERTCMSV
jgi:FMN reductase